MCAHRLIQAPEFPDYLDWLNVSHPLTINELKGKIILLEFWTYSCIYCHHNSVQLRKLQQRYLDELVIIGVHSGKFTHEKNTHSIRQAIIKREIEHPVVNDMEFQIWQQYDISSWPTIILIDPNGRVVSEVSGEILAEPFMQTIDDLIDEHQENINYTPLVLHQERHKQKNELLRYPSKLLLIEEENRLYISDTGNHRIIEVDLHEDKIRGTINRVFGNGHPGFKDGMGNDVAFQRPHGLAFTQSSNQKLLYVADTDNHAIRAIDLGKGTVETIAGTGKKAHGFIHRSNPTEMPMRSPWALQFIGKYLFIAMAGSHQIWVLIDGSELIPFAGNGNEALVDGPIESSSFNQPSDLCVVKDKLYVLDPKASALRCISLTEPGITKTLIGKGLFEFGDKDGSADDARFQNPMGLGYHGDQLFIADTYNHKIKSLDLNTSEVVTFLGNSVSDDILEPFDDVEFNEPEGIQASKDVLFIADTNNHKIKVLDQLNQKLHTLSLDNTQKLIIKPIQAIEVTTLKTVSVRGGKSKIIIDVRIPHGYIKNKNAPSSVIKLSSSGDENLAINEVNSVEIPVDSNVENELKIGLHIYYCEQKDYEVCFIHKKRLKIPLVITDDAQPITYISYQFEHPC